MITKSLGATILILAMTAFLAGPASAAILEVVYEGTGTEGDENLAARATFTLDTNTNVLTLLLENTGTAGGGGGNPVPSSVLAGIVWNFEGSSVLDTGDVVGAVTGPNATISQDGDQTAGTGIAGASNVQVDSEFGWIADGTTGYGGSYGVSANGQFGSTTLISIASGSGQGDLDAPVSLDGSNFGILRAGLDGSEHSNYSDEPMVIGSNASFGGSVLFTWNTDGDVDLNDISDVEFFYGTSTDEPTTGGECVTGCEGGGEGSGEGGGEEEGEPIPEPTTVALLGMGLAGMAATRARRKRM